MDDIYISQTVSELLSNYRPPRPAPPERPAGGLTVATAYPRPARPRPSMQRGGAIGSVLPTNQPTCQQATTPQPARRPGTTRAPPSAVARPKLPWPGPWPKPGTLAGRGV